MNGAIVCDACGEVIAKIYGSKATYQERIDYHNNQCEAKTQPEWATCTCECGIKVLKSWLPSHRNKCVVRSMCGENCGDSDQDPEEPFQAGPSLGEGSSSGEDTADEETADEDVEADPEKSCRRSVAMGLNRCIAAGPVTAAMQRLFCHPSRVSGKRAVLEDVKATESPRFAAEAPKRSRREHALDMQYEQYAVQADKVMENAMASTLPPHAYAPTLTSHSLPDPAHTHLLVHA